MRADDGVEVFVKHVGIFERYQPLVYDIKFDYDKDTKILNWTQPIENEEFKYTIYIDKINNIKKREYTLCDIAEVSKLAHYSLSPQLVHLRCYLFRQQLARVAFRPIERRDGSLKLL